LGRNPCTNLYMAEVILIIELPQSLDAGIKGM